MADPAKTEDQNILPVQALFNVDKSFNTFIGQGQPFIVSATESIGIQDVTALDATLYPTLSPVSTGQVTTLDVTSTKLTFNPSTGVLSATTFAGFLSGTASAANNFANGTSGQIPYQTSPNNTGFITNGVLGQVLTSNGSGAPTWSNPTAAITLQDDTSTNATFYPLFANNTTGFVSTEYTSSTKYQFNPFTGVLSATSFTGAGTGLTGTAASLSIGGNAATATSATTATNLAGGANGSVPYQTGSGATTMLSAGSNGQILTLAAGVPTWAAAPATGITITDDTTTNATRYLTFTSATAGSVTGENVSSTKLQYNPNTGTLTTTAFASAFVAITGGTIDGTIIGGTTPAVITGSNINANTKVVSPDYYAQSILGGNLRTYTGTSLLNWDGGGSGNITVNGGLTVTPANKNVNLSPTGTGTVTINPATASAMDNVAVGATTASTGAFTTLSASSTVSGTGFSTYLASPPAIGGTTAAAGSFTTLIGGSGSANYGQLTGGATTKAVEFKSLGSDTNVSYAIQSKGTGAIDLAAGSSGVNISNGGTVTAITRTAGGTAYATAPTVTISAPTTAGGVQATATCTVTAGVVDTTFTITNAGSGYVEQPTVSFSGGGGSGAAAYATVGSGTVIKSIGSTMSLNTPSGELVRFTDPSGSNSGYIQFTKFVASNEQQIIAANTSNLGLVATGGGAVNIRTAATGLLQMAITNTASAVNYVQVTGGATGSPGICTLSTQGSDTNTSLIFTNKGTGAFSWFNGNATSSRLFRVNGSGTNMVNHLQIDAAAAGASPSLSVGSLSSDTNIDLTLTPKGTGKLTTTAVALIGAGTALSGATNPLVAMTGNVNQYVQSYVVNNFSGTSASSDFVAYANNSTDANGWADMGFTSSTYADSVYTVTGPNEAYLFGSAPSGAGKTGNLVYATDSTGSANAHQFYVGGFTQAKSAWKAQIDATGLKATQINATNGIIANSQTVAANYTVATGDNAGSFGPVTVASGITVTISSGSVWTVV